MGNRNSGPRPRATALQLLRGVTRKDRLNLAEPQPPPGAVVKPAELTRDGGRIWDELAPVCVGMGTLTPADGRTFATLCELQAVLSRAASWKSVKGVGLQLRVASVMRPYYAMFGLDPVSRTRIRVGKPDTAPVSKWAGVLK
jgi:hypothetical protein